MKHQPGPATDPRAGQQAAAALAEIQAALDLFERLGMRREAPEMLRLLDEGR